MNAHKKIAGSAPPEADHPLLAAGSLPVDHYQIQPLTLRIREACRISGIGRSKLYELIKAREIAIIKVGGITLVPMEGLKEFLGIAGNKTC